MEFLRFRRYTLLSLDECLYALQPTIPHLTRSSLHRCLQRHGIGRLPNVEGDRPEKRKFKAYPIGYFHIDIAEVRTEQGKLHMFVAIDRTSKLPPSSTSGSCAGLRGFQARDHYGRSVHTRWVGEGRRPRVRACAHAGWRQRGHRFAHGPRQVVYSGCTLEATMPGTPTQDVGLRRKGNVNLLNLDVPDES